MADYYVYIMTNKYHTTLYTGVTNDIYERIIEHKSSKNDGFTKKHNITKLVYYEVFSNVEDAIYREKQIKKYKRDWKENLIKEQNQHWKDLFLKF